MRKLAILGLALAMLGCSETSATTMGPDPGPVLTSTPSRGVTQGGAQDIGRFRAIVEDGEVPAPDTLDPVGFFAEHAVDLGGEIGAGGLDRRKGFGELSADDVGAFGAVGEGESPGEDLEHGHAEAQDVGWHAGGVAAQHLGRRVGR